MGFVFARLRRAQKWLFCTFLSLSGGSRYRFWTQLAEMRLYVHFGLPTDRLGRVLAMLDEARLSQRSAGGDFARKGVLTPVPPFAMTPTLCPINLPHKTDLWGRFMGHSVGAMVFL